MNRTARKTTLLALAALALSACGSSSSPSSPSDPGGAPASRASRGAITAKDSTSITVNGIRLSTQGATVRSGDGAVGQDALAKGMVVTVKGGFDDRTGSAVEIEVEHGLEGRVDDKGTDFIRVGGQIVRVDDTTEFGEDNPARLGSIVPGTTVVAVSGVPDDKGGLRASRVDDSRRDGGVSSDDDDLDVKGFVSALSGSSFQLRLSPDSVAYWIVDASGISLPSGLANGAYVEVHTLSAPAAGAAPVLGTIVASRIEIEDRFGESEVEVEGIVTSGSDARFVVDGVTVVTDGSTRWELGAPADLVPGVKVEAEGRLVDGELHAHKVSFRPGVRLTGTIDGLDGASMTVLGVRVQLTSYMDNDFGPLANGVKVEVRGNPSASGQGIVAYRVTGPSGNESRVFVRAVATAKTDSTFTVMGFEVLTSRASFRLDANGDGVKEEVSRSTFFAAVEPGRTVLKARADSAADVDLVSRTLLADEIEIEND